MTPEQALEFFRVGAVHHYPLMLQSQFNIAYDLLAKLIQDDAARKAISVSLKAQDAAQ